MLRSLNIFTIELSRESLYPFAEFLRNELFPNFCKRISCSVCLVSSILINQRNNSDPGEAAHQNLALFCYVLLFFGQRTLLSGFQHSITNIRQKGSFIAKCPPSVWSSKLYWN